MSSVLSSIGVSLGRPTLPRFAKPSLYRSVSRRKGARRTPLCQERQDVPLIRRNTAVQGVKIDLFHRPLAAAFGDLEPSVQHRSKTRPRRAEPGVDAARSPFLGPFANLVGREEPCRLGARQWRFIRRRAAVREPDPPGIFHLVAEMPMQPG